MIPREEDNVKYPKIFNNRLREWATRNEKLVNIAISRLEGLDILWQNIQSNF